MAIRMKQKEYISRLKPLDAFRSFSHFQSSRAYFAWVTNSRPDIACPVAILTQITNDRFLNDKKYFEKQKNYVFKHLKTLSVLPLKFPKLAKDTLRIQAYSDASFATNHDKTAQL